MWLCSSNMAGQLDLVEFKMLLSERKEAGRIYYVICVVEIERLLDM